MRTLSLCRRAVLTACLIALGACKVELPTGCPNGASGACAPPAVATVTVQPTTATVDTGKTVQLTAVLRESSGSTLSGRTVIWASANVAIASVAADGLVRGIRAGTVTITATSESKNGSASVTVTAPASPPPPPPAPVATVTVQPSSAVLTIGQSVQLAAVLKDASGATLTGRTVTWTSSNTTVANVSAAGLVSAGSAGTTTITATSEGKSGSGSVTVNAPSPPSATDPELPRTYLDTRYTPPTGRTITVAAGTSLQAALDGAQPCDILLLEAGATFVGPFTLPNKSGSCWITIRSSASDASLPAEGTRMRPTYASVLPKIVSPDAGPALRTAAGAHHFRIMAVEVTVATSVTLNYGIVTLGDGGGAQNTIAQVPHDIILDRVYVHGHSTLNVSRCVAVNSASTAVIDSYLAECHAKGFDSQAICGWNGPGPFKIVNNFLEGAGEIVMFGGADPSIANLTPSDIEVRRNHFTRPTTWKGVWTVKNLFELKHAQRVLVEGNMLENHWADAQDGFAVVLKSVNQSNTAPWSVTQHVTFRLNKMRNVGGGVNMAAHPEAPPVIPANHIKIADNVIENVNVGVFTGNGRVFQYLSELDAITIEHNTTFASASLIMLGALPQTTNFIFRNNVSTRGTYGVFGSGVGEGTAALNYYAASGYFFQGNVIVGAPASTYPAGNFFPATLADVGFVNATAGNYRLASTSAYARRGTDGRDPGADIDAIENALQGVVLP